MKTGNIFIKAIFLSLFAATTVSAHEAASCGMRDSFTVRHQTPFSAYETFEVDQRITMLEVPANSGNWYLIEYVEDPDVNIDKLHRITLCDDATVGSEKLLANFDFYDVLTCTYFYDEDKPFGQRWDPNGQPDNFEIQIALVKTAETENEINKCVNAMNAYSIDDVSECYIQESNDHCVFIWDIARISGFTGKEGVLASLKRGLKNFFIKTAYAQGAGSGSGGGYGH